MREIVCWICLEVTLQDWVNSQTGYAKCNREDCECGGNGMAVETRGPRLIRFGDMVLIHPETEIKSESGGWVNVFDALRRGNGRVVYADDQEAGAIEAIVMFSDITGIDNINATIATDTDKPKTKRVSSSNMN